MFVEPRKMFGENKTRTSEYLDCFIVSVDYSDILSVTLPHNRRHFRNVTIITSPDDQKNVQLLADASGARVFVTDAFYRHGAKFNKWLALEEGLSSVPRKAWTCLLDADVLWPFHIDLDRILRIGHLYTPRRRMCQTIPEDRASIPEEGDWHLYPLHRQEVEFAGYSQIFHADDHMLGTPPWHQVDWSHAGGADSFFQAKWPVERKVRPAFQVLHLGESGKNWFGRGKEGTEEMTAEMWRTRRERRAKGLDPFTEEKIITSP